MVLELILTLFYLWMNNFEFVLLLYILISLCVMSALSSALTTLKLYTILKKIHFQNPVPLFCVLQFLDKSVLDFIRASRFFIYSRKDRILKKVSVISARFR